MGLRTAAVWLLVELQLTGERLAPLMAVAVTLPIAFLLTKLVMTQRADIGPGPAEPVRRTTLAPAA
jgi:hypothetical protein